MSSKYIEARITVPKEWLVGLEEGLGRNFEDLSQQQLDAIFSYAIGYVDFTKSGIQSDLRDEAGIKKPLSLDKKENQK